MMHYFSTAFSWRKFCSVDVQFQDIPIRMILLCFELLGFFSIGVSGHPETRRMGIYPDTGIARRDYVQEDQSKTRL